MLDQKTESRPRRLACFLALGAALAAGPRVAAGTAPTKGDPVPLTSQIVRKGLALLDSGTGVMPLLARLARVADVLPARVRVKVGVTGANEALADIDIRLGRAESQELRELLAALRTRIELDKRRNELLEKQVLTLQEGVAYQIRAFKYGTEAVLRKEHYAVPPGKLVVVVADFSSGRPDEGREVADEIAAHLNELRRHGIDVHVLVGEVRPGVVIRSEEMAQDVGRHFPPDTPYVVVWGTLSPRTVGLYRPHLSCVQKVGADRGVGTSLTLDLGSRPLPRQADSEAYRRECYERLIGVTCAAVPGCFAVAQVRQERTPDLGKFYAFLGEDSPEVKKLREGLRPLTRWTAARAAGKFDYLQRLDAVAEGPYPRLVRDTRDDSVLVLLTDDKGRPKRFPGPAGGKDHLVYVDVTEVTNRQYVKFLNAKGRNEQEAGAPWVKLEEFTDVREVPGRPGRFEVWNSDPERRKRYADAPVINVSWFGAAAYCAWAGKELPTEEEWALAAGSGGKGPYPWGQAGGKNLLLCRSAASARDDRFKNTAPVGAYPRDRSRVGCLDMAGNVAEWCDAWFDRDRKRVVRGGSYEDSDERLFRGTARRGMPPVTPQRWIGFRGVVRVPVSQGD
jgi:hypothetical protein